MKHYLDTVKDLENNKIGRQIGKAARHNHLRGRKAEKYIVASVVDAVDRDVVINHYLDPRVRQLPTLEQYGCPFLPKPVLAQANNTNGQTFTISGNR